MLQTTLASAVRVEGVGLHSGARVAVSLEPTGAHQGVVFERSDIGPDARVAAHALRVSDTRLATTLQDGAAVVSTVEHLLAAVAGLGVHNLLVRVDGPELPVMDGSATHFARALEGAGIATLEAPQRRLYVRRAVEVRDGDAYARLAPFEGCRVGYVIDYDHPLFRRLPKQATVDLCPPRFLAEVAWARTFGFVADLDRLQALGLARGGSLDNAVVVTDDGVLNPDGLRAPDEFVRHKLLDAIGDLALAGMPVEGEFTGYKSGHTLNNRLLRTLFDDPTQYEIL